MLSIESTINLSVDRLIDECSLGKKTREEIINDLAKLNDKNIHDIFKYRRFRETFTDKVTCYNNNKSVIGLIKPSYSEFLIKLGNDLGVDVLKLEDDHNLTKLLHERLDVLKNISSERSLKENFPNIFNNYLEGKVYLDEMNNMRRETIREDLEYEDRKHYYYSCGMRKSLPNYIATQSVLYNRFIDKRLTYKNTLVEDDLTDYFRDNFDFDKMAMYVTYKYLSICNSCDDLSVKKKYNNLVDVYIKSNYDKNVLIKADNGKIISVEDIVDKYLDIKGIIREEENKVLVK